MKTIQEILKETNAVITDDHIVLTSGKHSAAYINPDKLLPHTEACSAVGQIFADTYGHLDIDVVVGPAYGGIILSQWAAYYLSKRKKRDIYGLFTEKTPDKGQVFERGFEALVKGKNVLVVEDIVSTGGSAKKAAESVKRAGGNVLLIAVMVNRDPEHVTSQSIGFELASLSTFKIEAYDESSCPLCEKKIPINTTVGHGKEYLASKK